MRTPGVPVADAGSIHERLARLLGVEQERLRGIDTELAAVIEMRIGALTKAATFDELTGALRRWAGLDALAGEFKRGRPGSENGLVVALIDLDGLRSINYQDGFAAGDDRLRAFASVLLRRLPLVIRWGGDEFLCVLSREGDQIALKALAGLRVELSGMGMACLAGLAAAEPSDSALSLVERADGDLRRQRRLGS